MNNESVIFLPGMNKQLKFLLAQADIREKKILVIGAASEIIAKRLFKHSGVPVELVVPDFDNLMNARLLLDSESGVNVKLMDFEHTDYDKNEFDLVYAQASVSTTARNGIVKEIKRILKSGGLFCNGEIIALDQNYPQFIKDIFDSSDLDPMIIDDLLTYYQSAGFEIKERQNINSSLETYYSASLNKLSETRGGLNDSEKSYYKKLLNRISHESKAFLNQGGDKYIGFEAMILKNN